MYVIIFYNKYFWGDDSINSFGILNLELYNSIAIYVCLICYFIEAILLAIIDSKKENNKDKKIPVIDPNGHVSLIEFIALLIIMCAILILLVFKVGVFYNILYIPIIVIGFIFIVLKPFVSYKNDVFFSYYTSYASFSLIFCFVLEKIDFASLLDVLKNELLLNLVIIFILLLKIYLYSFSIIINIRYTLKMVKSLKFRRLKINFNLDEKLKLNHNKSHLLMITKKCKKLFIVFVYLGEILINILKIILYVLNVIFIQPLLYLAKGVFNFVVNILNLDDDKVNFLLCKILIIFSFIVVYLIIILDQNISDNSIRIFEYISSAILIPLALDSIISYRKLFNQ